MTATASASPPLLHPILRTALTALATIVTVIAVGVPALVFAHDRRFEGQVLAQADSPQPNLGAGSAALAHRLGRSRPDAPLVLSYHDIRELAPGEEPEDIYTVTPAQFSSHMAALDAAGYTTISSAQLARWLRGGTLPPRSVYLTFDDGTAGLWRYADRVLAEHDFRAAAFVITGRVGTHRPYYLTWDELRRMRANGRWDLESHTRNGHGRIPVNADGEREPFLINRAWLPAEGRQETIAELTARVREDVVGAKRDFVANDLPAPRFIAYPFSAEARPTNDAKVPGEVARILRHEYTAAFSNVEPDRLVSERDVRRRTLSRLEVFRFTTTAGLLARVAAASPVDPSEARPLSAPGNWVDAAGRRLRAAPDRAATGAARLSPDAGSIAVGEDGVRLRPPVGSYVAAAFAPGRTEDWHDFAVTATVRGLGAAASKTTATVTSLYGSDAPVELSVSAGYARLQVAGATIQQGGISARDGHSLSLTVAAGEARAVVDGREIGRAPVRPSASGGVAVAAANGGALQDAVRFAGLEILGPERVLAPFDAADPGPFPLAAEDRAALDGAPRPPSIPDRATSRAVTVPERPVAPPVPVTVPKPKLPTTTVPSVPRPRVPSTTVPATTVPATPVPVTAPALPADAASVPTTTVTAPSVPTTSTTTVTAPTTPTSPTTAVTTTTTVVTGPTSPDRDASRHERTLTWPTDSSTG
jgi:peptidoglycan/xylan/chitin deacetylase (PgdA/CDA1 family)